MLHLVRFSHVLAAMLISTQVFATSFDIAPLETSGGDIGAGISAAEKAFTSAAGDPIYSENVALISQTNNANIAVIDQAGKGNFAAIYQSGTTPSVAYIHQSGSGSMAVIRQH